MGSTRSCQPSVRSVRKVRRFKSERLVLVLALELVTQRRLHLLAGRLALHEPTQSSPLLDGVRLLTMNIANTRLFIPPRTEE